MQLTENFGLAARPRYARGWNLSDSHARSAAKADPWRVTGTIDTFVISWATIGEWTLARGIAATEVVTKIALYWLHERAWNKITWGRVS